MLNIHLILRKICLWKKKKKLSLKVLPCEWVPRSLGCWRTPQWPQLPRQWSWHLNRRNQNIPSSSKQESRTSDKPLNVPWDCCPLRLKIQLSSDQRWERGNDCGSHIHFAALAEWQWKVFLYITKFRGKIVDSRAFPNWSMGQTNLIW